MLKLLYYSYYFYIIIIILALIKAVANDVEHMKLNQEERINMLERSINEVNNKLNTMVSVSKDFVQSNAKGFHILNEKSQNLGMGEKNKKYNSSMEGVDVVGEEGEVVGCVVYSSKQVSSKMRRPSTRT